MFLHTIGHSTRPIDVFVELLNTHGVELLIDVRTVPRSRTNSQFNKDALPASLSGRAIHYAHFADLGGLRKAHRDSENMGWHNASFRGYADYMLTPEFHQALERLSAVATERATAIMCAEAVPWRCHRSLIADAMTVQGHLVEHLMAKTSKPHVLTGFANVTDGRLTYPAPVEDQPPI
ncbi:MAG: DUF488 domain-containing protein [Candidatus Dormibacteria bacterium]